MTEHVCVWVMDKYRKNSAYCIVEGCNKSLDPIDILLCLNEHDKLKRATERLSAEDAKHISYRLDTQKTGTDGAMLRAYADVMESGK